MAAEKRSQSGSQSIVDQDAAITAYLDGLLRDPEQDEAVEPSRSRKAPGLTVVNNVEVSEPALVDEPETLDEPDVDQGPTESDTAVEPMAVEEELDESIAEREAVPADTSAPMTIEGTGNAEAVADEPEVSDDEVEASAWAWLRVGGMVLAIPSESVASRHVDAVLEPVPGAPAQVAGALTFDGRPRLILSLATVTGARPRGNATEVVLIGDGGLWGVVGEPVGEPTAFDEDAVQWRSAAQKNERRGWLAGTDASAGVAVLDVAGLRAALKGSR